MSDYLHVCDYLKFKSSISFSSGTDLSYVGEKYRNNVFGTVYIPVEILVKWHSIVVCNHIKIPYVELLYLSQAQPVFRLKDGCTGRIEKRLQELCCTAKRCTVGLVGDIRKKKLFSMKKLIVYQDEVQSIHDLNDLVTKLQYEKQELEAQVSNLEERCENLLQEILKQKNTVSELQEKVVELENINIDLQKYIQSLEERDCCSSCNSLYSNKGKTFHEVSTTQKQRKLKEIKSNADKALWFLESFGLKIEKMTLSNPTTKENIDLTFNDSAGKAAYKFLNDEEKDKIKQVVYIMDSFCVSDAAYHELSMIDTNGLPRSYLIKQCRQDLNSIHSITRTPGTWPGAQLSFKEELNSQLLNQVIKALLINLIFIDVNINTINVNINSLSCNISHCTLVIFSFDSSVGKICSLLVKNHSS